MKCISILQPWASLVVTKDPITGKAYKQIETRSRNTKFRGPILIHASKKGMLNWMKELVNKWIIPYNPKLQFTTGAIIGMVNVVDTFSTNPTARNSKYLLNWYAEVDGKRWVLNDQEIAFGDYSENRYGWLLSDPILFKDPIPCKGNLSIWNLPKELEDSVINVFGLGEVAEPELK